jgi:hypothetical protein
MSSSSSSDFLGVLGDAADLISSSAGHSHSGAGHSWLGDHDQLTERDPQLPPAPPKLTVEQPEDEPELEWPDFLNTAYLLPPTVTGALPTLVFGLRAGDTVPSRLVRVSGGANHQWLHFRFSRQQVSPSAQLMMAKVFGSAGLAYYPKFPCGKRWCIHWGAAVYELGAHSVYSRLQPCQHHNHFPASHQLGHKHLLHQHTERQRRRLAAAGVATSDYLPRCFHLKVPEEAAELAALMAAEQQPRLWIVKPIHASQGIGIRLITHYEQITDREHRIALVQRYMEAPLLINGIKSDLRCVSLNTRVTPCNIRHVPLDCHCNSGVNSQY